MKRRSAKKSVSFQAHDSAKHEGLHATELDIPWKRNSVLALPFHLPFVLYSLFYSGLTNDPYTTMVKGLVNLIVMQVGHGFLLLHCERRYSSEKENRGNDGSTVSLILASTMLSIFLANALFIALILFGAPLYGYLKETYLLACHLSIIIFQPLLIIFRLDYGKFRMFLKHEHVYRIIFRNQAISACAFALLGSWIGVMPIPLDWDRPWQQWPITILSGGYFGAFVGSVLGLLL